MAEAQIEVLKKLLIRFFRYSQPTYCAEPGKVPGSWRYSQDLSLFVRNRTFPNVLLHVKVIMMHDSNS